MTGITGSALADTAQGGAPRWRASRATPSCRSASASASRRAEQARRDRRHCRRRRRRHGARQRGRQCARAGRARRPPTRPRPSRTLVGGSRQRRCVRPGLLLPHMNLRPGGRATGARADELDHQLRPPEDQLDARPKRDMPENIWIKDPETGEMVFHKDLEANQFVIPASGHHMKISAKERLQLLLRRRQVRDARARREVAAGSAEIPRREALCRPAEGRQRQDRPGRRRSSTRWARSKACRWWSTVQDFAFMGGSLGMAAGEAIITASRRAVAAQAAARCCSPPPAAPACRKASCR